MRLLSFAGMRMAIVLAVLAAVAAVGGCKKKSSEGLPTATSWNQPEAAQFAQVERPGAVATQTDDPHAGMNIPPANPTGDEGDEGDEPVDLQAPPPDDQIHAAASHATTSADPAKRIRGTIKVSPNLRDRVKAGAVVFLFVKAIGPDGQPTGTPLAVDRMDWTQDGAAFELGSEVAGDVFVMARVDQDGDAMKPQPGDLTAQVRAKVPADRVELVVDTVVP